MLSNRLYSFLMVLLTTALVTGPQAQTNGQQCPSREGDRALAEVGVFSGPPEDRAEQAPRPGGWDFGPPTSPTDRPFTLLCRYAGPGLTLTIVLPLDIRVCEFTTWPHVVCR